METDRKEQERKLRTREETIARKSRGQKSTRESQNDKTKDNRGWSLSIMWTVFTTKKTMACSLLYLIVFPTITLSHTFGQPSDYHDHHQHRDNLHDLLHLQASFIVACMPIFSSGDESLPPTQSDDPHFRHCQASLQPPSLQHTQGPRTRAVECIVTRLLFLSG